MPRATRYLKDGFIFHLTHRCHNRRFLLSRVRDRNLYRTWLHKAVQRYSVPVYGFCITGNHVHLIVHVDDRESVGLMMHLVAGVYGQKMNRKKGDEGSVWEHPYHCTLIQDGQHLLNCIRYVSLNMVRAGVVSRPEEWKWCSHDEHMGERQRYRIIDRERLLDSLNMHSFSEFRSVYAEGLESILAQNSMPREPGWTESLAIGERQFVEGIAKSYQKRSKFIYDEVPVECNESWTVREPSISYRSDSEL
jgi:putative transposase